MDLCGLFICALPSCFHTGAGASLRGLALGTEVGCDCRVELSG